MSIVRQPSSTTVNHRTTSPASSQQKPVVTTKPQPPPTTNKQPFSMVDSNNVSSKSQQNPPPRPKRDGALAVTQPATAQPHTVIPTSDNQQQTPNKNITSTLQNKNHSSLTQQKPPQTSLQPRVTSNSHSQIILNQSRTASQNQATPVVPQTRPAPHSSTPKEAAQSVTTQKPTSLPATQQQPQKNPFVVEQKAQPTHTQITVHNKPVVSTPGTSDKSTVCKPERPQRPPMQTSAQPKTEAKPTNASAGATPTRPAPSNTLVSHPQTQNCSSHQLQQSQDSSPPQHAGSQVQLSKTQGQATNSQQTTSKEPSGTIGKSLSVTSKMQTPVHLASHNHTGSTRPVSVPNPPTTATSKANFRSVPLPSQYSAILLVFS